MPLDWDAPSDGLLDATEPILSLLSGTECAISMLDQTSLPPDGMTPIPVWETSACTAWLDPRGTSVDGAGNLSVANSAPGRAAYPFQPQTSPTESPTVVRAGSGGPVLSFAGAQRLITMIPPSFGGQLGQQSTAGTCVWVAELFDAQQPVVLQTTDQSKVGVMWTTWADASLNDNVSGVDAVYYREVQPVQGLGIFNGQVWGAIPPGNTNAESVQQAFVVSEPGPLAVYSLSWPTGTLRRNGQVIATLSAPTPSSAAVANPQDRLVVGAWLSDEIFDGFMVGQVGHLMLFGRALTSDEVTSAEMFLSRLTFGQSTHT